MTHQARRVTALLIALAFARTDAEAQSASASVRARCFAQGISDVGTLGGPPAPRFPRLGARLPCPLEITSP
jgi:hypothetical protein